MLRTDTGNFNRFLTSLGLLLLLAALLIPYFYYRNTDVLRISQEELQSMTISASQSVEARQRRIADLEVPVAVFSILLGCGGVAALILGGRRLRTAQSKEDEAIDRRAKREDYEIRNLSTDEVEEKLDEQAREAASEASVPAPVLQEEGAGAPPLRLRTPGEARLEIARVEESLRQSLEGYESERYGFRAGVKIVSESRGSPPLSIDGLFEGRSSGRPDVALELKVTRLTVRGLQYRARMFVDPLLALLARYKQLTGRTVLGWLVVVIPEGSERKPDDERGNIALTFEREMAGLGKCVVINEAELELLPRIFGANFGH